jgi:glyoxylase I family protein
MNLSNDFHHLGIAVRGLEDMQRWYEGVLGFSFERRFVLDWAEVEIVTLLSGGGVRLELLHPLQSTPAAAAAGPTAIGAKHLCFGVDDIEECAATLRAKGISLHQEPQTIEESAQKNCWIADPEGNLIEFIEEHRSR